MDFWNIILLSDSFFEFVDVIQTIVCMRCQQWNTLCVLTVIDDLMNEKCRLVETELCLWMANNECRNAVLSDCLTSRWTNTKFRKHPRTAVNVTIICMYADWVFVCVTTLLSCVSYVDFISGINVNDDLKNRGVWQDHFKLISQLLPGWGSLEG